MADTNPTPPASTPAAPTPAAPTSTKDPISSDAKQQDQTAAAAAAVGAQAVAAAVTKVAEEVARAAAQAAATGTVAAPGGIDISGVPGGAFTIRGSGFGASGTLTISGVQIKTTAWGDTRIKGLLPQGLGPGSIIIDSGGKTQTGQYLGGAKK